MPAITDLTVEDVVLDSRMLEYVRSTLASWRGSSKLSVYGKTDPLVIDEYASRSLATRSDALAYSTWITKSWDHADYITSNIGQVLQLIQQGGELEIKHAGLRSVWQPDDVAGSELLRIKVEAVGKLFDGQVQLLSTEEAAELGWGRDRTVFKFINEKFADDYFSDATQPLMIRTKWWAERRAWQENLGGIGYSTMTLSPDKKFLLYVMPSNTGNSARTTSVSMYRRLINAVNNVRVQPVSPSLWRSHRTEVIRLEAAANGTDEAVLRQLKYNNYDKFWTSMKQAKKAIANTVDQATVDATWETIPLAETGTESSRGWGIEVETVRAHLTSRPRGWEDVYDGSLPDDGSGGCDCECDDCCDGEHCDYDDCHYNDGGGSSREFVSPILRHFNSEGLRKLCGDLPDDETSTAPGIHVHVGAEDLTVTDVARLLFAYGVVAPFITPLYHRKVFGYCQEMPGNNVQWWLTAAKRRLQETGSVPRPYDICLEQPVNRYQDVNTHALSAHSTLEFRAMGPFYNYEHLVRWAWFCREMVNVSRLNLDQRVWTSCESLADVINLLRKYGSEFPVEKALAPAGADTNNTYEE